MNQPTHFYFAAPSAADVDRIVAEGFTTLHCITVKLPYGNPTFVSQPGILVSTQLDPRTGFAVELTASPNPRYLLRHELVSPVPDVRYYLFLQDIANNTQRRPVSPQELQAAAAAGYHWQDPLVWFGKDLEPVRGAITSRHPPLPSADLSFSIGGYTGDSHQLLLHQGVLHYMHSDCSGSPPNQVLAITPAAAAWAQFWRDMDRIGVWSWLPEYIEPEICDGTQWSLTLRYGGRSIHSEGSNAYPGGDGPDYTDDTPFAQFLRALTALTGIPDIA